MCKYWKCRTIYLRDLEILRANLSVQLHKQMSREAFFCQLQLPVVVKSSGFNKWGFCKYRTGN